MCSLLFCSGECSPHSSYSVYPGITPGYLLLRVSLSQPLLGCVLFFFNCSRCEHLAGNSSNFIMNNFIFFSQMAVWWCITATVQLVKPLFRENRAKKNPPAATVCVCVAQWGLAHLTLTDTDNSEWEALPGQRKYFAKCKYWFNLSKQLWWERFNCSAFTVLNKLYITHDDFLVTPGLYRA